MRVVLTKVRTRRRIDRLHDTESRRSPGRLLEKNRLNWTALPVSRAFLRHRLV